MVAGNYIRPIMIPCQLVSAVCKQIDPFDERKKQVLFNINTFLKLQNYKMKIFALLTQSFTPQKIVLMFELTILVYNTLQ